jgi:hypothetical protein
MLVNPAANVLPYFTKVAALLPASFLLLLIGFAALAQDLPSEIRGYKVYQKKTEITNSSGSFDAAKKAETFVRIGQPDVVDVSLSGLTIAVTAELNNIDRSGEIDFLTFRDFRVNDMPVEIEDYNVPFKFKKNEKVSLPAPATMLLPTGGVLNAAWNEIRGSKKEWRVTGRVFAFGKFKMFGFSFKRVVPIDVKLTIDNPLR